jgi:serine/threonine-protein kinase
VQTAYCVARILYVVCATDVPAMSSPPLHLETGDVSNLDGRYLVDGVLAEGGMGVVLAARHAHIGRAVAIKIMRRVYAADRLMRSRFEREARLPNTIDHPGVVKTVDYGVHEGRPYFVMERLRGQTLAREVALGGPMTPARILEVLGPVCEIVQAVHAWGVVHRDIKPENVFLCRDGTVKLLDFGIASLGEPDGDEPRELLGTPHVMSPEQCRGDPLDPRSDIYALGVLTFFMCAGHFPFEGPPRKVITAHLCDAPPPLPPSAERIFGRLVARNLAKRPAQRTQSVRELILELSRIRAEVLARLDQPTGPQPVLGRGSLRGRRRFRRWIIAAAAGLLVASAAGSLLSGLGEGRDGPEGSVPSAEAGSVGGILDQVGQTTAHVMRALTPSKRRPAPRAPTHRPARRPACACP